MGKKFDMLALGEVLLRLSPEGNERLTQGTRFEKQLGGAELNVAVGAANLGLTTGVISKIPSHAIGNYAKREIRRNGVDTDYLAGDDSADSRLGIYYYEYGADPRKPQVVYDRKYSSVNKLSLEDFPEEMSKRTVIKALLKPIIKSYAEPTSAAALDNNEEGTVIKEAEVLDDDFVLEEAETKQVETPKEEVQASEQTEPSENNEESIAEELPLF